MSHTHRDYEPFEMGENMEEDLGLFQAAVQPRCDSLAPVDLAKVLVVDDGSNQSETVRRVADSLATRTGAELVHLQMDVVEQTATSEFAGATSRCQRIRSSAGHAGLTILPVPFGEDISELDTQSLGTVADMLLNSEGSPLLCIRQPLEQPVIDSLWDAVLVAVSNLDRSTLQAMKWSFRLAKSRIIVVEWLDQESLSDARQLLEGRTEESSIQQSMLGRAVTSRLGPLVGATQRQARKQNLAVHVEFRPGNPCRQVLDAQEQFKASLVVVGRSADSTSQTNHFIEDLLRASRLPVLVI